MNLKELSKSDLVVLQYQIESTIRTRRVEAVRRMVALENKDAPVRLIYDILLNELRIGKRGVIIDAYLDQIETMVDIGDY